jgi:RimJ/RimL family protein N-acetyltransferase
MENLCFRPLENELEELISFMTMNQWEYHGNTIPSAEKISESFRNGWYHEDRETFWIEIDGEKIGLAIIHDISDTIPLFDLRLSEEYRGKGIGKYCVHWIVKYLFQLPEKKIRIEAYTRADNIPMRKTLFHCGFVKEGYLRNSWENDDGSVSDSLCYAIIRDDWENGTITPIKMEEYSF